MCASSRPPTWQTSSWFQDRFRLYVEYLDAQTFNQRLAPLPIDINRSDLLNLFVDVKIIDIDGHPVYSCTTLAVACQGKKIETLESFDTGAASVPHAFHQCDGLMCGYCTPGFVTACKAMLDQNKNPSLADVKRGLDGNICRCGTYIGVFQAALDAAKAMKGA